MIFWRRNDTKHAYTVCGQRWLNRDPLGELGFETLRRLLPQELWRLLGSVEVLEGPNIYTFVRNDSLNLWDLYSLSACTDGCNKRFKDDQKDNLEKSKTL